MSNEIARGLGGNRVIIARGLGVGVEEEQSLCEKFILDIEAEVHQNIEYFPATGIHSIEEDVKGWLWNKSSYQVLSERNSRIETSIGGITTNLDEGQVKNTWDSNPVFGTKISSLEEDKYKRYPMVKTGVYSIFHKEKRLYGELSSSVIFDALQKKVPDETKLNTISATLFKRDRSFNNVPYIQYSYDESLTETYSFKINEGNILERDSNFQKDVATDIDPTYRNISCLAEEKGYGNSSARNIYTNYFPILDSSLRLFSVLDEVVTEWQEVDNVNLLTDNSKSFSLDNDKGIIYTSGYKAEDLRLRSFNNRSLEVFESTDAYPESGYVSIRNEIVFYKEKTKYKFLNITRGALGSAQVNLVVGDTVEHVKQGHTTDENEQFYIIYKAVPRVDFDIYPSDFKDNKINLKPVVNFKQNGIIALRYNEKHVSKIVLSTNKDNLFGNTYGPLFIGNDIASVVANVYDSNENAVEEIPVTFRSLDGKVKFEGDSLQVTNVTNDEGIARSIVFVPYDENIIKQQVQPNYIGNKTYFDLQNFNADLQKEDITIFQRVREEVDGNIIESERLMYIWDENKIHPLTGLAGSYVPLSVESLNNGRIVFDYKLPKRNINNLNILGYSIYFPQYSTVICEANDPASGRLVQSNPIRLKIDLPRYLKGYDGNIAYGFGILNPGADSIGTGLGGSNFLTINPLVDNRLNLSLEN